MTCANQLDLMILEFFPNHNNSLIPWISTIQRWQAAAPRVRETIHSGCPQHRTDHRPQPASGRRRPVFTLQRATGKAFSLQKEKNHT